MGYIHSVQIENNQYLLEPLLYTTAGGTLSAITADISNFELVAGAYVSIKINGVNDNATLNVNNTGAKAIYYNTVPISAGMLVTNNIYTFIYDNSHWNVVGDLIGSNIVLGTTAEWTTRNTYIAPAGAIVIYTDRGTVTETVNGSQVTKTVPGIKIGDGSTPIIDKAFVGDDVIAAVRAELQAHINDTVAHITAAERLSWNNKINCEDTVSNNTLVLNRN